MRQIVIHVLLEDWRPCVDRAWGLCNAHTFNSPAQLATIWSGRADFNIESRIWCNSGAVSLLTWWVTSLTGCWVPRDNTDGGWLSRPSDMNWRVVPTTDSLAVSEKKSSYGWLILRYAISEPSSCGQHLAPHPPSTDIIIIQTSHRRRQWNKQAGGVQIEIRIFRLLHLRIPL